MRSSEESAALTGAEALVLMVLTVSGGVAEMADAEPGFAGAAWAAAKKGAVSGGKTHPYDNRRDAKA